MNAPAAPSIYGPRRPHDSDFLTLRGLRHHLLRWGPTASASPQKPLLVLLHGWMDVGASFQFLVDALSALNDERPILAMDWRGFGLSDNAPGSNYWFPDYLADLDALLDQISPELPVDLLGHSMGGNVVMSYAGVRPERVRRLINLEGFGLPEAKPEQAPGRLATWLKELKEAPQLRPYASLDAVAQRLIKTNPRLSPDKAAWLAPHWSRQQADGSWQLLADPAHKRANPILYRKDEIVAGWKLITAPTLWVEGDASDLSQFWGDRYPRADFEARLSAVPRLDKQMIRAAGHMLHHDQPEALARCLEDFLLQ
ncbi:alpha/beta fold hydrolase [Paucibacter sp. DJ2R-2]|uniref:alpha/beta fold hydrolase n=1 Tax=Paucibacter sp. DJ2R-2 TaxID=2893558 RepID=UPI0021E4F3EC|nr:alpha/beta hydrolase [Paucibacter sp. DJ2R-2]MCV2422324.1 alpha/beta hydrolase [Paucibacter sp. DJ4R-1]MCV2440524.1 alpha/beta hydrolase [Paucibacter sp. DJ2R-2]